MRPRYARSGDVHRAVRAARENGLRVSSIELGKDGTIRLSDQSTAPAATMFDALEKANKL